jgi:hypothetical protein
MADLTEPERLALAYITQRDASGTPAQRERIQELVDRLAATSPLALTDRERGDLASSARHEIETNRYPLAPHLGPLRTAFAKLAPHDAPPKPPISPHRPGRRRRS